MRRRSRRWRARARLAQAGADCVKFEGARPEIVRALKREGYRRVLPHRASSRSIRKDKRRQGKTAQAAAKLLADALELDAAGPDFLVLELIPRELAAKITQALARRRSASAPAPNATRKCWSCMISPRSANARLQA